MSAPARALAQRVDARLDKDGMAALRALCAGDINAGIEELSFKVRGGRRRWGRPRSRLPCTHRRSAIMHLTLSSQGSRTPHQLPVPFPRLQSIVNLLSALEAEGLAHWDIEGVEPVLLHRLADSNLSFKDVAARDRGTAGQRAAVQSVLMPRGRQDGTGAVKMQIRGAVAKREPHWVVRPGPDRAIHHSAVIYLRDLLRDEGYPIMCHSVGASS